MIKRPVSIYRQFFYVSLALYEANERELIGLLVMD